MYDESQPLDKRAFNYLLEMSVSDRHFREAMDGVGRYAKLPPGQQVDVEDIGKAIRRVAGEKGIANNEEAAEQLIREALWAGGNGRGAVKHPFAVERVISEMEKDTNMGNSNRVLKVYVEEKLEGAKTKVRGTPRQELGELIEQMRRDRIAPSRAAESILFDIKTDYSRLVIKAHHEFARRSGVIKA